MTDKNHGKDRKNEKEDVTFSYADEEDDIELKKFDRRKWIP